MRKLFTIMLTLAVLGLCSASFAKSRGGSRSSSKSSSSKSSSAKSSAPTTSSASKTKSDSDKSKPTRMGNHAKMYRCRLPDGSTNPDASKELCLKVGGQWVRH